MIIASNIFNEINGIDMNNNEMNRALAIFELYIEDAIYNHEEFDYIIILPAIDYYKNVRDEYNDRYNNVSNMRTEIIEEYIDSNASYITRHIEFLFYSLPFIDDTGDFMDTMNVWFERFIEAIKHDNEARADRCVRELFEVFLENIDYNGSSDRKDDLDVD